jgi:hypothetical protein
MIEFAFALINYENGGIMADKIDLYRKYLSVGLPERYLAQSQNEFRHDRQSIHHHTK